MREAHDDALMPLFLPRPQGLQPAAFDPFRLEVSGERVAVAGGDERQGQVDAIGFRHFAYVRATGLEHRNKISLDDRPSFGEPVSHSLRVAADVSVFQEVRDR